MWKVTLKGLAGHRVRFTLTALAVMLGVAFMAGTLVLTDTVGKAFDDLFADVNEGVDVAVRAESPFDDDFGMAIRPRIPADLLDDILAVEGVATAEGFVQGFAQLVDKEGDVVGQPGQGPPTLGFSWPETAELNPLSIAEGRPPEGPADVVIDKKSADDGEFAIGDEIDVVLSSGTRTFTVVGIARFGEVDSPAGATIAVFETATAQEVLDAVGQYDEIDAVAEEGVSQEELAGRVREALAGQESIEVLTGAELTEETQDEIRQQLSFFNNFLLTFAIVALFVGSFIIYNTFSIVVAQRAREMALLRAVGASRAQVLVSVVGEAVVVGLLASIVGMGAGIGLAIGLEALLAGFGIDVPSGAPVVTRGTITAAVVTGVLVTVVAAVVPARKASRVPPVAALRDVAIDTSSGSLLRVILGSLVLLAGVASLFYGLFGEPDNALLVVGGGAGVVFLGMAVLGPVFARPLSRLLGAPLPRLRGITGALARNNAMRNPKRTSATASALMIGVGLVGFITVFAASAKASIGKVIDDAFLADYVVDSGTFGFGGLSPELAREIGELPDVQAVSGIRGGFFEVEGDTSQVVAVEPTQINQLFDVGVSAGRIEDMGPSDLAVQSDRAEEEGWSLGDTVTARFAETGLQELTIAALYDERQPAGPFTITTAGYEANFEDQFDVQVYVRFVDGTDLEAARGQLEEILEAYPNGELQDQAEFRESLESQINQLLALVFVLLALAVIIALIGIANSITLSVYERTREIGLVRAVGMTRRQVRSSVRWESVIVALLGTALGLVVAVFFGWALVQALRDEGFEVFQVPFGQLAVIVVVAGLAGVLAAVGPARRAAKLDVLRAVTTE